MSELRTNRIIPRDGLTSGTGIGGGIIQIKQTILKKLVQLPQITFLINKKYQDLVFLKLRVMES